MVVSTWRQPSQSKDIRRRGPSGTQSAFTAAAANEGWLCVIRPGNIGRHGDDKGFCDHCSSKARPLRQIVRDSREATVNRAEVFKPVREHGFSPARRSLGNSGADDVRLLLEALDYATVTEFPAQGRTRNPKRATAPCCSMQRRGLCAFSSWLHRTLPALSPLEPNSIRPSRTPCTQAVPWSAFPA